MFVWYLMGIYPVLYSSIFINVVGENAGISNKISGIWSNYKIMLKWQYPKYYFCSKVSFKKQSQSLAYYFSAE
jgi:hypothetical protein